MESRRLIPLLLMLVCPLLMGQDYNVPFVPRAAGGGGGLTVGDVDCAQSAAQVSVQNTTSLTITAGSTVVVGMFYTTVGGGFTSILMDGSTATGAVQVGSTQSLTDAFGESRMYYIPNVSGASHTFGVDVANDWVVVCAIEIEGANTSDPLDVGSAAFDSAEPYTGGVTTTVTDTILVAFFARDDLALNPSNPAESSGFVLGSDDAGTDDANAQEENCANIGCGDIWTRTGPTATTYTASSTDDGTDIGAAVHVVAIKE